MRSRERCYVWPQPTSLNLVHRKVSLVMQTMEQGWVEPCPVTLSYVEEGHAHSLMTIAKFEITNSGIENTQISDGASFYWCIIHLEKP